MEMTPLSALDDDPALHPDDARMLLRAQELARASREIQDALSTTWWVALRTGIRGSARPTQELPVNPFSSSELWADGQAQLPSL